MSAMLRFVAASLALALLLAPIGALAQTPSQPPSFEPSMKILRDSLALNGEQAAKLREVFDRHAPTLTELRERARRQPFSQKLQLDVQSAQQALRDDISIFLSAEQKAKLPRLDARLGINLPPGFVFIPVPPRTRDDRATPPVARERLIVTAPPANTLAKNRASSIVGRMTEEQKILHVLNRLAFGPRPGDIERVRLLGVEKFIDEQLRAEAIDDSDVEKRLAVLPTLQMTFQELYNFYPPGNVADQRYAQANPPPIFGRPQQIYGELVQQKLVRAVSSNRQLQEVMTDFWFNHFNVFAQKGAVQWMVTGYERDVIRPNALGKFRDLLLAVAESPAMLFYLDNWLSAAPDSRQPRPPRPQQNPRPAPGANLASPAAEAMKTGQEKPATGNQNPATPNPPPPPQRRLGINENYARELMELHTLGVDGGYTQKDVQEVARAFTGWTIDRPYQAAGGFVFRPWMHDNGAKTVLGVTLPAGGGITDGKRVIEILARHPSTARFVSRKLCQRFVADNPPAPLVERVAQVFLKTDGDIKAVLRAIFTSQEFYSPANFRAKVKSPLELAASAIRALHADTSGSPALHEWLRRMGEPLYQQQAPTGYGEDSAVWMNAGVFLNRINFGVALANNQIAQTSYTPTQLLSDEAMATGESLLQELTALVVHTELSPESKQAVRASLEGQPAQPIRAITQTSPPATPQPPSNSPTLTTADVQKNDPRRITHLIGVLLGTTEFQKK